ncbi:MAG: hypothetical protein A2Y34_09975 [Spirochaetes bacterium GWC1_27_15]|nr:MAG: hypothetical protein A2Z98_02455 [Spirochaetes bacterium GWB1_27_13]OHD25512.1 MAG: hypothetical protein A2Y34_09975 [Spirochaetes bacterium GWC1_27_15]
MSKDLNTELYYNNKITKNSILSNKGILVVLSPNFLGKTFIIDKQKIIIGRSDECDFVIKDPLISKEHCQITIDDNEQFFIEDLGSRNSTYLNGKELKKKTQIFYTDKILIGDTITRFFIEEKLEKK